MWCAKFLVRCLLGCLLVHVLWASQSLAEITENSFPVIVPGSLYVGDVPAYMEQVWLYLLDDNYFVLKKTRSVSGKSKSVGQFTGRWRQVDGGANLQLTNDFGLSLAMNIGSTGKLYSSMQVGDAISSYTLAMTRIPFSKPLFKMSAVLEVRGSRLVLTDSAAGRTFAPVEGDLDINSIKKPVFIEADVSLAKHGVKIEKIYSSTEKLPSSLRAQKENFDEVTYEETWQNDAGNGIQAVSCYFRSKGTAGGILEISGQGLHLELPYRLEQQALQFFGGSSYNSQNLTAEARRWLEILSGHVVWQYEGKTLILRSPTGINLQLHNARR